MEDFCAEEDKQVQRRLQSYMSQGFEGRNAFTRNPTETLNWINLRPSTSKDIFCKFYDFFLDSPSKLVFFEKGGVVGFRGFNCSADRPNAYF